MDAYSLGIEVINFCLEFSERKREIGESARGKKAKVKGEAPYLRRRWKFYCYFCLQESILRIDLHLHCIWC